MSQLLAGLRISNRVQCQCRTFLNRAALRPAPPPRGTIATPVDFLKAIGRSADSKVEGAEQWNDLWKLDGHALRKAGLGVKDRKYILWSIEKFRQGEDPAEFAYPPTPKKKVRGRGPAVQNGKRIRSRRLKH